MKAALAAVTLPFRYWLLAVAGMLWQGLLYACLAFFTDIITEKFEMAPEDAGRITSVVSVIALCVAPFGGRSSMHPHTTMSRLPGMRCGLAGFCCLDADAPYHLLRCAIAHFPVTISNSPSLYALHMDLIRASSLSRRWGAGPLRARAVDLYRAAVHCHRLNAHSRGPPPGFAAISRGADITISALSRVASSFPISTVAYGAPLPFPPSRRPPLLRRSSQ